MLGVFFIGGKIMGTVNCFMFGMGCFKVTIMEWGKKNQ